MTCAMWVRSGVNYCYCKLLVVLFPVFVFMIPYSLASAEC